MSVYVDPSRFPFGRMTMCHMIADSPGELHAMAERIGIKRRWFQGDGSTPHYDICKAKRALAVASGAVELERRQFVLTARRCRTSLAWLKEEKG